MRPAISLAAIALASATLAAPHVAAQQSAPIKKDEIQDILQAHEGGNLESFLEEVHAKTDNSALKSAVDKYLKGGELDGADEINIFRLLGIYTRLRYQDDVVALLGEMVAIPTYQQRGTPQHESPAIKEFGDLVERKAEEFGLDFRNIDDRIFEVELQGRSDEAFGILTHSDVVPADESEWVLEDGTRLDPFELTIIGDKLYGRGTEDDKGSIASALYAMKSIKENDVPLQRTIRLMIETTEETGGEGFEYYKERNELPEYNIVLDSRYPAVIAEKGFGTIDAYFPRVEASGEGPVIVDVKGATATNQIPETASATIRTGDPQDLKGDLSEKAQAFAEEHGGDFGISVEAAGGDEVKVVVEGKSAHSSTPEDGINPVPRLLLFLADSGIPFQAAWLKQAAG